MRHILNISLLALLLSTKVVIAQQSTLSIEDCRLMAIETNFNLKSSKEKISISEDMLSAYKTNRLPSFTVNGNYLYSTSSFTETITGGYLPIFTEGVMSSTSFAYMPDIEFDVKINSIFNAGVMATQPIYMGGKISNAIKLASIGVDVSKIDKRRSEVEVIELTDRAFYSVIEVEELLATAHRYQSVVEEFYRQMESAYKHGMKKRNDLMQVEVRLNEAKLLTQRAENGLRLAKMNLCYRIGLPLSKSDFSLKDPMFIAEMIINSDLDISSRPEYNMLKHQIEAKELEVQISKSDFMPSITALGSASYTNGVSINGQKLFNAPGFAGGVMVSVPIFHWGEGRRKVSAKKREITIAKNQMEDLSLQMQLELMQAINNFNESILEVELTTNAVKQADENMRLSRNQYDIGLETIADYLESQALWQKAMSDLCSAKASQRIAYIQYQRCCGEL